MVHSPWMRKTRPLKTPMDRLSLPSSRRLRLSKLVRYEWFVIFIWIGNWAKMQRNKMDHILSSYLYYSMENSSAKTSSYKVILRKILNLYM